MQQDRKRTPGLTAHFDIIRNIKSEIDAVSTQIETLQKQKTIEINKERESPERLRLFTEKELINTELSELYNISNTLKKKKFALIDELNALRNDIKNVKGKNAYMTMADIDNQRALIEQKMIDTQYTNQQEKEYQATLLDLHKKKQSFGDLGGKEKCIHDLEKTLQTVKNDFAKVNEDIDVRKKEQQELKSIIDGMRENRKSAKIAEIEKQIDALYDKKKLLAENRKKEHEVIKQKEEEHAKYLEVMGKQIEIENQKKDQKTKIRKMIEELDRLENERTTYDCNKYETIIKELEKKALSLALIGLLNKEKLKIPRCDADYEALLKTLNGRKNEFEKGISDKIGELDAKIKELEENITEEKKTLEAMPATEISIARKKIN